MLKRNRQSGFTLVEVVIAIGVVGVGMVAVLGAVATLSDNAAYTSDTVAAMALAQDLMAEIDTRPFAADTPTPTGRTDAGLVAWWPCDEGTGTIAGDQSRILSLAPLEFAGEASWISGMNGVNIGPDGQLACDTPYKILSACQTANEFSVEVWLEPARLQVVDAPIIIFGDRRHRNFSIDQKDLDLLFYLQTSETDRDGELVAATRNQPLAKETLHVAAIFTGNRAALYVNGMPLAVSRHIRGDLRDWRSYSLQLGDKKERDSWSGKIFQAAVYSRALTDAEIRQNFDAGPSPGHLFNRSGYDDIDDYNGYADSPPRAEDGSVVEGAQAFSRTVEVVNVLPQNLSTEKSWNSTDAKRVTVKVFKNYKLLATLVRGRYRGASADDTAGAAF